MSSKVKQSDADGQTDDSAESLVKAVLFVISVLLHDRCLKHTSRVQSPQTRRQRSAGERLSVFDPVWIQI